MTILFLLLLLLFVFLTVYLTMCRRSDIRALGDGAPRDGAGVAFEEYEGDPPRFESRPPFAPGDVVRLRSGGPEMTVESCVWVPCCVWADSIGAPNRETFPSAALELVRTAAGVVSAQACPVQGLSGNAADGSAQAQSSYAAAHLGNIAITGQR